MTRLLTSRGVRIGIIVAGFAAVLLPLAVIWVPEFRHYYVATPKFDATSAREVIASINPATCTEFTRNRLAVVGNADQGTIEQTVRDLERGVIEIPGSREEVRFTPGFAPNDLLPSGSLAQLMIASLAAPDLMISAWDHTGRLDWLRAARDYIHGWWSFESRSVLPRGLQWNDHAVAARVFVLTKYLCAAKHLPEFGDSEAAWVLEMIFASGERLTRPSYYTYRTNHGIMENLALLHIAASFPATAQSKGFAEIGARRLREQVKYYIGPEGPILEHSAGYHALGVELLGLAIRYFHALNEPLPDGLLERYAKAVEFFEQLRRADGSLPSWGDTSRYERVPRVLVQRGSGAAPTLERVRAWREPSSSLWAPVSGVAVWWQGVGSSRGAASPAQTLVTWANFATQAHKHADEMSLLVWTQRSDVLIASGYWPYDASHGREADGWAGSNAPRYAGEDAARRGRTKMLGYASLPWLEFVDMERTTASGGKLRRQIIYLRPGWWIILDTSSGASAGEIEVTWTFDPQLTARVSADGKSILLDDARGPAARAELAGCEQGNAQLLKGSMQPFAGWTAASGSIRSAPALLRRCPVASNAVFILRGGENANDSQRLVVTAEAPDRWDIRVADAAEALVERRAGELSLGAVVCGGRCRAVRVMDGSRYDTEREAIDLAYQRMSGTYARYNESRMHYRIKASFAVGGLWLAQLGLTMLAIPFFRRRIRHPGTLVAASAMVLWICVTVWLDTVYLA